MSFPKINTGYLGYLTNSELLAKLGLTKWVKLSGTQTLASMVCMCLFWAPMDILLMYTKLVS